MSEVCWAEATTNSGHQEVLQSRAASIGESDWPQATSDSAKYSLEPEMWPQQVGVDSSQWIPASQCQRDCSSGVQVRQELLEGVGALNSCARAADTRSRPPQ